MIMSIERRMFLKPVPGKLVRDPVTLVPLSADGEWKPATSYWDRKVLFGDCTSEEAPSGSAPSVRQPASDVLSKRTRKLDE
jgi:hypothetical protein